MMKTVIFRLSQKLARKVKAPALSVLPEAADPLTDWSAHVFNVSRTQYLLVCNTRSLYSAVMFARGINDVHRFIVGAMSGIADAMREAGFSKAYDERIAAATGPMLFGKAISRQVTGSMNDLIALSQFRLQDETTAPSDLGAWLNQTPFSILEGLDGGRYGRPLDVMEHMTIRGRRPPT